MPRILLVDDDVELTELLSELLSLEGFEVYVVHNGQEAIEELETRPYDLMLLDIMMPVLNGVETLKKLRLQKKIDIPVLMLSARDSDIDRILGLELGADDYLPKPFNDRELIARIKAILRRAGMNISSETSLPPLALPITSSEANENSWLSFAGVDLHLVRQQAFHNGINLDLTGTEFSLLLMLIRNPGQTLSRELISLEILGKQLTPYDRAVDMHISNLRKKLPERNDNLPWFKTLRGRGYLLVIES